MELTRTQINRFQETVWEQYRLHGRPDLPWRQTQEPYEILVSEIMLQQTQVPRVIPKYQEFLVQFPTVASLAEAPFGAVLRAWQGLGYNRRAKFLHEAAKLIVRKPQPWTYDDLIACKGIGQNTAKAVLVYSFAEPFVFVETNVRTVYIHHFFKAQASVSDKEILECVEQTLDREHPREFFLALMDYGSHLKSSVGNLNKVSKSYVRQSKFHGSRRQVRGHVIRELSEGAKTEGELMKLIPDDRLRAVLQELETEQMVHFDGARYTIDYVPSMIQ